MRGNIARSIAAMVGLLTAGCGGLEPPPPPNYTADCVSPVTSDPWVAVVRRYLPPDRLGFCPLVVRSAQQEITGTILIETLLSTTGWTTAGHLARIDLWTLNTLDPSNNQPRGAVHVEDIDVPFQSISGELVGNENPLRAQASLVWLAGFQTEANKREVDSLEVQFYTDNQYSGQTLARLMSKTPVVIDIASGTILGSGAPIPGVSHYYDVQTPWDPWGYRYKWFVDGVHFSGDTAWGMNKTFSTLGAHSLRIDLIGADASVVSTYRTVNVPMVATVQGPSEVNPAEHYTWYPNVPYGMT